MINRINVTALVLAAALFAVTSFAAPRQASAAIDPACKTKLDSLVTSARASGRINQVKVNEIMACLKDTSSKPRQAGAQTIVQPQNGLSPIASISGTLFSVSLLNFGSSLEFCDNLYPDTSTDWGGNWYGVVGTLDIFGLAIGAYGTDIGRSGFWLGPTALVFYADTSVPLAFTQYVGLATLSSGSCELQQEQ